MFCSIIDLCRGRSDDPCIFVTSKIYLWREFWSYCDSGVCDLSLNVSSINVSIVVPRCLSSESLVLLQDGSLEPCSENGICELILIQSGIGRGVSSSPSSSSSSWLSDFL